MFVCFIFASLSEYYTSKSDFYSEVEHQRCIDHKTDNINSRRSVSYNDIFSAKGDRKNSFRKCNDSSRRGTDAYFCRTPEKSKKEILHNNSLNFTEYMKIVDEDNTQKSAPISPKKIKKNLTIIKEEYNSSLLVSK